jgi:DNA-binding LacI/PurR family transcriptional regulator
VSPSVVSYVLNGGPRSTSVAARERVLNAIRELDYHPNASARGLRFQQTRTIGLLLSTFESSGVFESPYIGLILGGLVGQLKARGYWALVYPLVIGQDLDVLEGLLRSKKVDGVVVRLLQEPHQTHPLLEIIAATGVPCVCIEQPGAERFGFGSVTYDDGRGAYDAVAYLLAQGHRRIGHVGGDLRYLTARARVAGYRRALLENDIVADESLVYCDAWNPGTARAAVARMFDGASPPTAIFAANDSLAFVVVEELRKHGYRVPEDVSVVGFDDIELSREMDPPLTTVRIPLHQLGVRAADLLLEVINDDPAGAVPRSEVLSVELVRRSTA